MEKDEGPSDENPKTAQIQGPMTRSKTKQSMDTLQQMVVDIRSKAQVEKDEAPEWRRMKAQVEKDEGPEAEALPRLLIVAEGSN